MFLISALQHFNSPYIVLRHKKDLVAIIKYFDFSKLDSEERDCKTVSLIII